MPQTKRREVHLDPGRGCPGERGGRWKLSSDDTSGPVSGKVGEKPERAWNVEQESLEYVQNHGWLLSREVTL